LQVVDVDDAVLVEVFCFKDELLAIHVGLRCVEFRVVELKERRFVGEGCRVAVGGVRGRDELLEAEVAEVEGEELGEVGPLRVVAGQQDDLVPEHIGVEFEVGVDLAFDVGPLGVELVVLRRFGRVEARSSIRDRHALPC
jgi:hypothetical protein